MEQYIPLSFEESDHQIQIALGQLKKHGLNITLPDSIAKRIQATTLFDGDDSLFKELIKSVELYYEYGSGKSTEYVYKYSTATIHSIDTSRIWVERIRLSLGIEAAKRLKIRWVDVGEVADWGTPVSFKNRHNFRIYAELLWQSNAKPELVLIDGRFRVLCFLCSLKFAPVGTYILFDDYMDRPFYHVAEEFSERLDVCGRQALFEVTQASKEKVTEEILLSFQNVIG